MINEAKYDNIDILFFERPLADLKKFAFKISKVLKTSNPEIRLGVICIEMPLKPEETNVDYFFHGKEIKDIDEFLLKWKVKEIVFSNTRIPDLELVLHAHKLGIKTTLIQEGIVFDGVNINDISISNIIATFGYLRKAMEYLNIMRKMCLYDRKSYIRLLFQLIKIRKNITIVTANFFSSSLICDYVLTMGDYWENYYINKWGYAKEQIMRIGSHDLDDFEISENNESAICYIASVLVEDGMISREEFLDFIDALKSAIGIEKKLYIKLHPRSDLLLYESLNTPNIEMITQGSLPSVNLYIGQRSSLLGRALYESDNLIVWRLSDENEGFYEKFACAVCSNKEELVNAVSKIDLSKKCNRKRALIENVYWKNPSGAINTMANFIVKRLYSGFDKQN